MCTFAKVYHISANTRQKSLRQCISTLTVPDGRPIVSRKLPNRSPSYPRGFGRKPDACRYFRSHPSLHRPCRPLPASCFPPTRLLHPFARTVQFHAPGLLVAASSLHSLAPFLLASASSLHARCLPLYTACTRLPLPCSPPAPGCTSPARPCTPLAPGCV
jgi:hypothetical protein